MMPDFVSSLVKFASRFKGFLAFAAFILLVAASLVTYLFSQGSFDTVLKNFGKLSGTEFLSVVYIALGLPFIILVLLIILGYRIYRPATPVASRPGRVPLQVRVFDEADRTKAVANAQIRLTLADMPPKQTDINGNATIMISSEFIGSKIAINASMEGYEERHPITVKLTGGRLIEVGLKRKPEPGATPVSLTAPPPTSVVNAGIVAPRMGKTSSGSGGSSGMSSIVNEPAGAGPTPADASLAPAESLEKTPASAPITIGPSSQLSNDLYQRCRAALWRCPEFADPNMLANVLADPRLDSFQVLIPQAPTPQARALNCLNYLRTRSVHGDPALARLLDVLSELQPTADNLPDTLAGLANEVRMAQHGP